MIIKFNKKKQEQFNKMYDTLKHISQEYYQVAALRAAAEARYGLHPDDAVDQAYENMRNDAKKAISGVKPFRSKQ